MGSRETATFFRSAPLHGHLQPITERNGDFVPFSPLFFSYLEQHNRNDMIISAPLHRQLQQKQHYHSWGLLDNQFSRETATLFPFLHFCFATSNNTTETTSSFVGFTRELIFERNGDFVPFSPLLFCYFEQHNRKNITSFVGLSYRQLIFERNGDFFLFLHFFFSYFEQQNRNPASTKIQ